MHYDFSRDSDLGNGCASREKYSPVDSLNRIVFVVAEGVPLCALHVECRVFAECALGRLVGRPVGRGASIYRSILVL